VTAVDLRRLTVESTMIWGEIGRIGRWQGGPVHCGLGLPPTGWGMRGVEWLPLCEAVAVQVPEESDRLVVEDRDEDGCVSASTENFRGDGS